MSVACLVARYTSEFSCSSDVEARSFRNCVVVSVRMSVTERTAKSRTVLEKYKSKSRYSRGDGADISMNNIFETMLILPVELLGQWSRMSIRRWIMESLYLVR